MPQSLKQKRKQIYDHFLKVIAKPEEYPILYQTLANNAHGYCMRRSSNEMECGRLKTQIAELEQRLDRLEAKINKLAYMADLRMTLTEQRQDLFCKVLVKLTKPQQ